MRIYIAAPSEMQDEVKELRSYIEGNDFFKVKSSWIDLDFPAEIARGFAVMQGHAEMDLVEIEKCDLFIAVNPEEYRFKGTGGRHVEFGWALSKKKPIIVLGVRSNIFHNHGLVRVCGSQQALMMELDLIRRSA